MATTKSPLPTAQTETFVFPKKHAGLPAFYTLQPNQMTLTKQLTHWSNIICDYCRHHRLFQINPTLHASLPLFDNTNLHKKLSPVDIRKVLDFMASSEGDFRAEWTDGGGSNSSSSNNNIATTTNNANNNKKISAWIWYRKPEEWGQLIWDWVDETGQKGTVLTLYEIVEGEGNEKLEFYGLDGEVLKKALAVLSKQGKAQVFGTEGGEGVKFF